MAIYYAQRGTANINTAGLWDTVPTGGGSVLTWADLQPTDVLCANGKTGINVVVDVTCGAITTLGSYGGGIGANGGQFYTTTAGITLDCDIVAGTTVCIQINNTTGVVAVLGNVQGGSGNAAAGVHKNAGAGTVTITGTVAGGSASYTTGAYLLAAGGTIIISGDVTGGGGDRAYGARNASAGGTLTVNGTVTGGAHALGFGVIGEAAPATVIGSLVDSATTTAVAGKVYWQPQSVAHYWQVALDGTSNQRYTIPPVQGNVRNGVNYGYYGEALNGGTLVLPAITDVKLGVGYGEDGTEYDGQLVAGGGGVPLIGPGGLVG